MATDTNNHEAVTVERDARLLREALSKCRRDVSIPLKDKHIANLIKRVENDRAHPCEHIVTIMHDAFARKASREMVEAPARALLAMVGEWYAENQAATDLPTLLRQVKEAEVVGGMAELEIALNPSPKTIADGVEVLRRELVMLEQLVSTCERSQFTRPESSGAATRMVA